VTNSCMCGRIAMCEREREGVCGCEKSDCETSSCARERVAL